jgi:hypothetical protein
VGDRDIPDAMLKMACRLQPAQFSYSVVRRESVDVSAAWPDRRFLDLIGVDVPIVQAPMAG